MGMGNERRAKFDLKFKKKRKTVIANLCKNLFLLFISKIQNMIRHTFINKILHYLLSKSQKLPTLPPNHLFFALWDIRSNKLV